MKQSKETLLNLKYFDEGGKKILKQRVQIVYEDGTSELIWREIEGQENVPAEPSFSDRFKHDTFQPHPANDVKTEVITRKLKLDINLKDKMSTENMMKNIERGVRTDNLLRKLLNTPEIIKEKGFDFKGNDELKKAMSLLCYELGGEWAEVPSFFK